MIAIIYISMGSILVIKWFLHRYYLKKCNNAYAKLSILDLMFRKYDFETEIRVLGLFFLAFLPFFQKCVEQDEDGMIRSLRISILSLVFLFYTLLVIFIVLILNAF